MILEHGPQPQMLIAAHVSQKNNRAELVEQLLRPLLAADTHFLIAEPAGTPVVQLPLVRRRPRQLSLFAATSMGWES
jgi:hypothetical protein